MRDNGHHHDHDHDHNHDHEHSHIKPSILTGEPMYQKELSAKIKENLQKEKNS